MTVSEHLDRNSFAYDAQFPPDVAAGLPLAAARRARPGQQPPMKRAMRAWTRVVSRRR
jgi:hypothetical protein